MRRFTLRFTITSRLVASLIFISMAHAFASPPPPLIRAATSNNGQFLVGATFKLGPPGEGGGQMILGETFEINSRETFASTKGRLTSPNQYWVDSWNSWKIELPRQLGFIAPWPIISDDGSTLILVGVSPPMSGMTLLAIYKKDGHNGQLLRSYTADDLWDLKPGDKRMEVYLDSTPEWFDNGKFSFSDDGHMLLYTDKEHGNIRVSLQDGTVARNE
ncbi:MAG TPA: hypothetical protein VIX42_09415 [Edaphobacter sp.]